MAALLFLAPYLLCQVSLLTLPSILAYFAKYPCLLSMALFQYSQFFANLDECLDALVEMLALVSG